MSSQMIWRSSFMNTGNVSCWWCQFIRSPSLINLCGSGFFASLSLGSEMSSNLTLEALSKALLSSLIDNSMLPWYCSWQISLDTIGKILVRNSLSVLSSMVCTTVAILSIILLVQKWKVTHSVRTMLTLNTRFSTNCSRASSTWMAAREAAARPFLFFEVVVSSSVSSGAVGKKAGRRISSVHLTSSVKASVSFSISKEPLR
mmetsp:Transcript_14281/g.19910  ORF Transcript_14281/g.19910 Transcript_14281/m.19910 type:complete len:202 (+) Transcript_14281:450-1055(+)